MKKLMTFLSAWVLQGEEPNNVVKAFAVFIVFAILILLGYAASAVFTEFLYRYLYDEPATSFLGTHDVLLEMNLFL